MSTPSSTSSSGPKCIIHVHLSSICGHLMAAPRTTYFSLEGYSICTEHVLPSCAKISGMDVCPNTDERIQFHRVCEACRVCKKITEKECEIKFAELREKSNGFKHELRELEEKIKGLEGRNGELKVDVEKLEGALERAYYRER